MALSLFAWVRRPRSHWALHPKRYVWRSSFMPNKAIAAIAAGSALAAAQYVGALFRPDSHPDTWRWYQRLDKSRLTPPGAVFGIAWTILDTLLAYSGYRLMTARPCRSRSIALVFWALNVVGIPSHSITLFGRRRLDEATLVTAGMVASSTGLVTAAANVDQRAKWTALPLAGWLLFAMYLQEEVWRRNRRRC
jgi:translocator protein